MQDSFSTSLFQNPPIPSWPVYSWPWNSHITRELIDRQLDDMLAAGIRAAYVIPMPIEFRPTALRARMKPGYLTEAFFDLIRYAAEGALARGMAFWLYDEAGWPSGGARYKVAALNPDLMRTDLDIRTICLKAGVSYRPCEDVVAAFAGENRLSAGTRFDADATIEEYVVSVRAGSGLTQILDRRTTDLFIDVTHSAYAAHLGDMIGQSVKYMFTDEPNAGAHPWPEGMDDLFKERFGYEIFDYLPAIWHEARIQTENDRQARIDYYTLCGELLRQNFLEPIRDWCRAHGMISCGHFSGEDTSTGAHRNGYGSFMAALRRLDFPGVDLIWRQLISPEQTSCPEPSQIPFFPRCASSAARQIGQNLSLSESFNIYGAGLTWNQTRYLTNYQIVRGINMLNGMNVPAGRERATPLNMRPCYTPEIPGPTHMSALNECVARAQYLMQLGEVYCDVALYTPDRDYLAGPDREEAARRAFVGLGQELEQTGYDFDYIDDEAIRSAQFIGGALVIGKAAYRHVFVPECRHMPEDVRQKLTLVPPDDAQPIVQSDCPDLRARRRMLPNGKRLYFVFNEGRAACMCDAAFQEKSFVFELILETGEIVVPDCCRSSDSTIVSLRLESGEARVLLFDDAVRPTDVRRVCAKSWPVTDFQATAQNAYVIDDMGIRRDALGEPLGGLSLGGWKERLGESFSGEVVYSARVTPDAPLKPGDKYLLKLGRVEYSARVFINGKEAGIAAMAPFEVSFEAVEGALEIDIEVANTPANQVVHTDAFSHWPETEIGWYHPKTLVFERESLGGGLLDPVTLCLMRPMAW